MELFPLNQREYTEGSDANVDLDEISLSYNKSTEQCNFCNAIFKYPGSLGRHLDRKKGDDLHPLEQVQEIRKSTKRRKSNTTEVDVLRQVDKKIRGQANSRKYNLKEHIKEKNKLRRKTRDRQIKAKLIAHAEFIDRFGKRHVDLDSNFAYIVCMFLPLNQWPQDPPDSNTFSMLRTRIEQTDLSMVPLLKEKATESFERWRKISKDIQENVWQQEKSQCLSNTLGNITLFELQNCSQHLDYQSTKIIEDLEKNDYKFLIDHLYDSPHDLPQDSTQELPQELSQESL